MPPITVDRLRYLPQFTARKMEESSGCTSEIPGSLAFLGLGATDSISWGTILSWVRNDPSLFGRTVWPRLVPPPAFAVMSLILAAVWVTWTWPDDR